MTATSELMAVGLSAPLAARLGDGGSIRADQKYTAATNTAAFTATGAQVAGAAQVVLDLTGSLAGDLAITLPTAANIVAAIPYPSVGENYRLRVINTGGGHTWTVTTNTGLTLTGTMTVATNTWRDFIVTLTSLTAVAVQAIGTGTQS